MCEFIDLLKFIFSSFWVFCGVVILSSIALSMIGLFLQGLVLIITSKSKDKPK